MATHQSQGAVERSTFAAAGFGDLPTPFEQTIAAVGHQHLGFDLAIGRHYLDPLVVGKAQAQALQQQLAAKVLARRAQAAGHQIEYYLATHHTATGKIAEVARQSHPTNALLLPALHAGGG